LKKIGIECVKSKDIPTTLEQRLEVKGYVDPFGLGFDHMKSKSDLAEMDMNSVCLSFQVFIPWNQSLIAGARVVSDVIKDKRVHELPKIVDISDNYAPVKGGKKIIMFTSKIKHDDIQVLFEYNHNGMPGILEKHVGASDIHKQCAVSFSTPIFPDQKITQEVQAKIYLFRPSDGAKSEQEVFYFQPNKQNEVKPRE